MTLLGRLLVGAGAGALAGTVLGTLDAVAGGSEPAVILAAGLLVAMPGALFGLAGAPFGARLRARRGLFLGAGVALAILGAIVDALVFPRLYPEAHWLAGLGALAGATLAALALAARDRPPMWLSAGLVLAALGPIAVPVVVGDSLVAWQQLRHDTRLAGRLAGAWSGPSAPLAAPTPDVEPTCEPWPAAAPAPSEGAMRGANLVVLSIDAFRFDVALPSLAEAMPATAKRLEAAVRFDRAYAPGSRTTTSVYAMLTGRYPHALVFDAATTTEDDQFIALEPSHPILRDPSKWKLLHRYPLSDRTPTLAEILESAGYRSGAVVPDVGLLPAAGVTRGFGLVDASPYERNGRRDGPGKTSAYSTDAAIEFVQSGSSNVPFFLWVHYLDPHHPYEAEPPTPADAPVPERYMSEFRRVDTEIERLLATLSESGVLENTVVVLTGDHGEEFRDHGGLRHGTSVYDELVHVPLFIWTPKTTRARRAEVVSLVDLAPTLLDLAGVQSKQVFDGRSLAPALAGSELAERPVLLFNTSYTEHNERQLGIVAGAMKLIADEGARTIELYDLRADPQERTNLASSNPKVVERLRCRLQRAGVASPDGE